MGERLSDLHLWYENEFQEILVKYNLNREQMENLFGHYEMRINLASFVREKRWQEDLDDEIAEQRAKLDEHSGNVSAINIEKKNMCVKYFKIFILPIKITKITPENKKNNICFGLAHHFLISHSKKQ